MERRKKSMIRKPVPSLFTFADHKRLHHDRVCTTILNMDWPELCNAYCALLKEPVKMGMAKKDVRLRIADACGCWLRMTYRLS